MYTHLDQCDHNSQGHRMRLYYEGTPCSSLRCNVSSANLQASELENFLKFVNEVYRTGRFLVGIDEKKKVADRIMTRAVKPASPSTRPSLHPQAFPINLGPIRN